MTETARQKNNREHACSHVIFTLTQDFPMTAMFPWSRCWKAAIAHGIETLAITDHYDPGYPDPEFPFQLAFSRYLPALQAVQTKHRDKIEILAGMEIGILKGHFEEARRAVDSYPFRRDHRILSLH